MLCVIDRFEISLLFKSNKIGTMYATAFVKLDMPIGDHAKLQCYLRMNKEIAAAAKLFLHGCKSAVSDR